MQPSSLLSLADAATNPSSLAISGAQTAETRDYFCDFGPRLQDFPVLLLSKVHRLQTSLLLLHMLHDSLSSGGTDCKRCQVHRKMPGAQSAQNHELSTDVWCATWRRCLESRLQSSKAVQACIFKFMHTYIYIYIYWAHIYVCVCMNSCLTILLPSSIHDCIDVFRASYSCSSFVGHGKWPEERDPSREEGDKRKDLSVL